MRAQISSGSCSAAGSAAAALESRYGEGWAERLQLEDKGLGARACGAILSFLHTAHFDALEHRHEVLYYCASEFMVLDEVTLRNLEILRNIRDRSRRGTLLEFLGKTRTPMGARTLARWIQMPLLSLEAISRRLSAVEELNGNSVLRESLAMQLKGVCDLERLMSRVSCGCAGPKELVVLQSTLERLPGLQKILEDARSPYLVSDSKFFGMRNVSVICPILSPLPAPLR